MPGNANADSSGIGVSPGIAIGPAYIGDRGDLPVSESHIPDSEIDAERSRFAEAVAVSVKQLRKLKTRPAALPGTAADELGYLLDAHLADVGEFAPGSRRRPAHREVADQRRARDAARDRGDRPAASRRCAIPILPARIEDIRVVGTRLIRNLIKKPFVAYSAAPAGAIVSRGGVHARPIPR